MAGTVARSALCTAPVCLDRALFQSSPAPRDERYMPTETRKVVLPCFNPRPPRRTSAMWRVDADGHDGDVSILARPEGRALPGTSCLTACAKSFQSSPAPKDERY